MTKFSKYIFISKLIEYHMWNFLSCMKAPPPFCPLLPGRKFLWDKSHEIDDNGIYPLYPLCQ